MKLKKFKTFEAISDVDPYGEEEWGDYNNIICEDILKDRVERVYPHANIYPRMSRSSIISTIRTLQLKGLRFSVILSENNLNDEEGLINLKEMTFHHITPYDILFW